MHLCLSSGSSDQYRRDVLRALAMPAGTRLQFRYWEKHVHQPGAKAGDDRELLPGPSLIAYVDQTDMQGKTIPAIVPVRFAELISVSRHGSMYALQLELREFCVASDLAAFNKATRDHPTHSPPEMVGGKIVGQYWLDFDPKNTVRPTPDLTAFEETVTELASHTDFKFEKLFYHIQSVTATSTGRRITPTNGEFTLAANASYRLEVYHFRSSPNGDTRLVVESGTPSIAIRTNPTLYISSRYDFKWVGLRVTNPPPAQGELPSLDSADTSDEDRTRSVISLFREEDKQDKPVRQWDFDIPVMIKPDYESVFAFGAMLGMALSTSSLVLLWLNQSVPTSDRWVAAAFVLLGNMAFGLFAAFGLRKPTV
jgi:hypothetical protein